MTSPPVSDKTTTKRLAAAQSKPGEPAAKASGNRPSGKAAPKVEPQKSRAVQRVLWGLAVLLVAAAAAAAVDYWLATQREQSAVAFEERLATLESGLARGQERTAAEADDLQARLAGLDERLTAVESQGGRATDLAGRVAANESRSAALAAETARAVQDAARAQVAVADLSQRIAALESERRSAAAWRRELTAAWLSSAELALTVHNDARHAEKALDALGEFLVTSSGRAMADGPTALAELRLEISATGAARERLRAELQTHAAATVAWEPGTEPAAPAAPAASRWQRFKAALARLFVLRKTTPRDEAIAHLALWRLDTERRWHDLALAFDFADPERLHRSATSLAEHLAAADPAAADSDLAAARRWLDTLATAGLPEWPSFDALRAALQGTVPEGQDS